MSFNGSEGNPILPSVAHVYTKAYRELNPGKVVAHFIGRDILLNILAQENCMGIRLYYGTDKGVPMLMAVGADNEENDQLIGGIIADEAPPSPPVSGQDNFLNSDMAPLNDSI